MKTMNNEYGAVEIVEAALVFPIVLFVVILFIFIGNLFYQQAKVDAITVRTAEYLARLYTHPMLENGASVPTNSAEIDVQPYRYLFGSGEAEEQANAFAARELGKTGEGFFQGMGIHGAVKTCVIKNYIVYQTVEVEIEYSVQLAPFKLFDGVSLIRSSCATVTSAADPAEFIRNVDMIMDYAEISGLTALIQEKVGKFFN